MPISATVMTDIINKRTIFFWLLLVALFAVILPRFAALGYYIDMDEGYHDYMARFIQHSYATGSGFPHEIVGFKLYQVLLFWLYNLPGNGTVWLRLADMLVAIACCMVFTLMLIRESNSRIAGLFLGLAFFTGMNLDQAINSGYKNSFFPAFLCYFLAINLARNALPRSRAWFGAGVLTALAVLFRETFVLFPVIGFCSLLFTRQYSSLIRFTLGGIAGAIFITLIMALIRGQLWGLIEFYFVYGKIYEPEESRTWPKFLENGGRAIQLYAPLLLLTLWSIYSLHIHKKLTLASRSMFWLAASLAPILEPMLKIGFLYHFSACLPGMAGLCAYAYGQRKVQANKVVAAFAIACLIMQPLLWRQYAKLPVTLQTFAAWPNAGWPSALTSHSTTLEAADTIRKLLPENGTVSSSGFAYFIYPASNTTPPEMGLADLSRTFIYSDYDAQKFREKVNSNPPDVVLLAAARSSHSATFERELTRIFDNHPDYEYVETIVPDRSKNYGWLGYHVYRKKASGTAAGSS